MRLQYSKIEGAYTSLGIYSLSVLAIFLCVAFGIIIKDAIRSGESSGVIVIGVVGMILMILVLLLLIYSLVSSMKKMKNGLERVGERVQASIIEARVVHKKYRYVGELVVTYQGGEKTYYVEDLEINDAFELLKLLLNPYPIKENIQVPIDLYFEKKNIYADLESVNFSSIKGYEEAKKIIEQKYKKD